MLNSHEERNDGQQFQQSARFISLPRGGRIKSINEKSAAGPITGMAAMTVSIAASHVICNFSLHSFNPTTRGLVTISFQPYENPWLRSTTRETENKRQQ